MKVRRETFNDGLRVPQVTQAERQPDRDHFGV